MHFLFFLKLDSPWSLYAFMVWKRAALSNSTRDKRIRYMTLNVLTFSKFSLIPDFITTVNVKHNTIIVLEITDKIAFFKESALRWLPNAINIENPLKESGHINSVFSLFALCFLLHIMFQSCFIDYIKINKIKAKENYIANFNHFPVYANTLKPCLKEESSTVTLVFVWSVLWRAGKKQQLKSGLVKCHKQSK